MTAEIVVPGRGTDPIPAGTSIYWLNQGGEFVHLSSLAKGDGFRVVVEDHIEDALAVTLENRREFLLPSGEIVIPG